MNNFKILIIDLETKPLLVWSWGIGEQYIGLEQIEDDWRIMSVAAMWDNSEEIFQFDLRDGINNVNEKKLLKKVWDLLNEADIVVGQNSKKFDVKKLNDKFLEYGLGEPSPYRQIDTYVESKKYFSPTSHKLQYRSKQLNEEFEKLSHNEFPGMSLWINCIKGVRRAWDCMAQYNMYDVRATKEYYHILRPWIKSINFTVVNDGTTIACHCGSTRLQKRGFSFTNTGKFQRFQCKGCRKWLTSKKNILTKEEKEVILK